MFSRIFQRRICTLIAVGLLTITLAPAMTRAEDARLRQLFNS
jgi:hypothetical protein